MRTTTIEELDQTELFLPYQKRWCLDEAQVRVAVKSRRVGISWAEAFRAVLDAAASKDAGGCDVWYLCQTAEAAKEFATACADFARALSYVFNTDDQVKETDVLPNGDATILITRITFTSRHRIVILPGTRPSSIRGKEGRVIFDEALKLDIQECLESADALRMWGGTLCFITTQADEENQINTLLLPEAERKGWSVHEITIHDAVKEGLYKRICLKTRQDWTQAAEDAWVEDLLDSPFAGKEYLCIPGTSGGVYIPRSLVESRTRTGIPIVRLNLPAGWELSPVKERKDFIDMWWEINVQPLIRLIGPDATMSWGMDFGRSPKGDLSIWWPLIIQRNLHRRTPFVVELCGVPFDSQQHFLKRTVNALPRWIGAGMDFGGNGAYLAEFARQRWGDKVEAVNLGPWYALNLPKYKAAFERAEMTIPADNDIVTDHSVFIVNDKGIPTTSKLKKKDSRGGKRHGDSAIAGALAYIASKGAGASRSKPEDVRTLDRDAAPLRRRGMW